jgi:hypothetical protein
MVSIRITKRCMRAWCSSNIPDHLNDVTTLKPKVRISQCHNKISAVSTAFEIALNVGLLEVAAR